MVTPQEIDRCVFLVFASLPPSTAAAGHQRYEGRKFYLSPCKATYPPVLPCLLPGMSLHVPLSRLFAAGPHPKIKLFASWQTTAVFFRFEHLCHEEYLPHQANAFIYYALLRGSVICVPLSDARMTTQYSTEWLPPPCAHPDLRSQQKLEYFFPTRSCFFAPWTKHTTEHGRAVMVSHTLFVRRLQAERFPDTLRCIPYSYAWRNAPPVRARAGHSYVLVEVIRIPQTTATGM